MKNDFEVITVNIPVQVTFQDLSDLFCTVYESDSSAYWSSGYIPVNPCLDWKSIQKVTPRGDNMALAIISDGHVVIYENYDESATHYLTHSKLMRGFVLWVQNHSNSVRFDGNRIDFGMVDTLEADRILQYSLLGELVYG